MKRNVQGSHPSPATVVKQKTRTRPGLLFKLACHEQARFERVCRMAEEEAVIRVNLYLSARVIVLILRMVVSRIGARS